MPTPEGHLWIDQVPRPGWENMAIDHAMLEGAKQGVVGFRLYRWNPPCLSFGAHEPALRRYDRARIRDLGIDCVRRPTGGRAVWHCNELTYSVAAPLAGFDGPQDVYRRIHTILATALRHVGLSTTLAEPGRPPTGLAAGACFNSAVGGEILFEGSKLVGSAQLIQAGVFLQHGSILLTDDQALIRNLTPGSPLDEWDVTTLERALGREVLPDELANAIAESVAGTSWSATWKRGVPPGVLPLAERLGAQYRDSGWTWHR